jgi:mannose-6-phosphate isomerase-like protein (cupin superfamily)
MHTSRADLEPVGTSAPASADGYTARAVDELPELWDGFARLVRAGLGITAFGVQIMELPPDYTTEAHDEAYTGQQELYVALRGAGAVVIGDERLTLDPEHLVRVDAGVDRVLTSGADGVRVLCVGGVPGAPYEPPDWTAGA